jgi:hypothetical protein
MYGTLELGVYGIFGSLDLSVREHVQWDMYA